MRELWLPGVEGPHEEFVARLHRQIERFASSRSRGSASRSALPEIMAIVALFGGPAGAGKSTLAAAWCADRPRAVHVELDEIRSLVVSGLADPQQPEDPRQHEQYALSVAACCALARVWSGGGYDVAVGDALAPEAFERHWRPCLEGLDWRIVIVVPTLDETLARSRERAREAGSGAPLARAALRLAGVARRRPHRHVRAHRGGQPRARAGEARSLSDVSGRATA